MVQTEQEKLIGPHPVAPHIYGLWLKATDTPSSANKKHRKIEEIDGMRGQAIDELAKWIVNHHVHSRRIDAIIQKKNILDKNGLDAFIDNMNLLPKNDNTRKGNVGEILLIEYLKESRGFSPIVYKFHYNPNTEQSMKGDDVLLFN